MRKLIMVGEDLRALVDNILSLDPCEDCGGEPALVFEDTEPEATVLHRPACPVMSEFIAAEIDQDWRELNGRSEA